MSKQDKAVMYSHDEEEEFLIPVGGGGEDLSALMWWGRLGANMKNCEA